MRRVVHLRVVGTFDQSYRQEAHVTIDRDSGLFAVRPFRRRREYVLPLADVASMVVARATRAELQRDRAAKRRAWRPGRGRA